MCPASALPDFGTQRAACRLAPASGVRGCLVPPSPNAAAEPTPPACTCVTLPMLTTTLRFLHRRALVVRSAGAIPAPNNIMYDKRVVRGNTYAAQILPAVRAARSCTAGACSARISTQ